MKYSPQKEEQSHAERAENKQIVKNKKEWTSFAINKVGG